MLSICIWPQIFDIHLNTKHPKYFTHGAEYEHICAWFNTREDVEQKTGGIKDFSSSKSCFQHFCTTFHWHLDINQIFEHYIDLSVLLVYYARAVDPTVLMPLNDIATEQTKATEKTQATTNQMLDYLATHPDATIRYHASDMILNIHSDAS
jgi:hypothetical protein